MKTILFKLKTSNFLKSTMLVYNSTKTRLFFIFVIRVQNEQHKKKQKKQPTKLREIAVEAVKPYLLLEIYLSVLYSNAIIVLCDLSLLRLDKS